MTIDYEKDFGPNGRYAWPGCLEVADRFLEAALSTKSGPDCLDDGFFLGGYLAHIDEHFFEDYPGKEAYELAEASAKSRQELFKDAKNWPLPCLVASAVYEILSAEAEQRDSISQYWRALFWSFLLFDEPLFGMLRAKGWGKICRDEIREGFQSQLMFEIHGHLTPYKLVWGSDKEKPWFTCQRFTSHIYPEDVLRCLDLIGIDQDVAHWAVDEVFKLHSLTPFWAVLSDDPSQARRIITLLGKCKQ